MGDSFLAWLPFLCGLFLCLHSADFPFSTFYPVREGWGARVEGEHWNCQNLMNLVLIHASYFG